MKTQEDYMYYRKIMVKRDQKTTVQLLHSQATDVVLSLLLAHTYITIWCATTHDNKTHVPYDCILHTQ